MLVALVAALSLVFAQTAIAASAASLNAPASSMPHMPCEMADGMAKVPANSAPSDQGKDRPCSMMSGATCLALSAVNPPQASVVAVPRLTVDYLWPADSDVVARAVTPPDKPPKTL